MPVEVSSDPGAVAKVGQERPSRGGSRRPTPDALVLAAAALSLVICGGLLVYGSGRGLDLTDEVFYLIWARDPNAYPLTYQPFGHVLHPLFRLVGGDLQLYRLAGFAIAASAGAFLGRSLSRTRDDRAAFVLYGALAALTIFFPWIITPSYNSAANVGAMLIVGGLLKAFEGSPRARIAGVVAGAAGLCLAAFAKPPLFAIAVAALGLAAVAAPKARAGLLAVLVLGAALMSLILAPWDLAALVGRMAASQHVLGLPNTPLALPAKVARDWLAVPPLLSAAAIAAGAGLILRRFRWAAWLGYAAVALSLFFVASIVADAIDGEIPDFLGLALATAVSGYAGIARHQPPGRGAAVALLLVSPAAVALGTFNNQWFQLNFSMAFPFLALFALASTDSAPGRRLAAQALAIAGPVAVMVLAAFDPYSLPASIFDQQVAIESPLTPGSIRVDAETAAFVRSAHGLARGAPLVDLSGTGPGVAAALGARAPVLAWLNPATPTWPDVAWSRMSADERRRAAFVAPVWPQFEPSAPARWLIAHKAGFCRTALPAMTFWGKPRSLELWRPCATAPP